MCEVPWIPQQRVKLRVDIIELIVNGGSAGLRDWDRINGQPADQQIGCVEDSVMAAAGPRHRIEKVRAGHVSVVSS